MALEAGRHGRRVRMLELQLGLNLGVTRKAKGLRLFFQEGLASAVVAGMTGLALALAPEGMGFPLLADGPEGFVADHTQGSPTPSMEEVDVRDAMFLVAPLASALLKGFVRR